MRIINHRTIGALVSGAAVLLTVAAVAGPADATALRRPTPPPAHVAPTSPAPSPAAPSPAVAPIAVTGAVTRLGVNFSAGGYALVNYSVKTTAAGQYTVRYTAETAGSGVNTTIDSVSLKQIVVGAAAPVTTTTFTLTAGVHTIGTQSPDGYGSTSIDLVRVG